jgi:hypothetical protein
MILWRARASVPEGADSAKVKEICLTVGILLHQYWEVAKSGENPDLK